MHWINSMTVSEITSPDTKLISFGQPIENLVGWLQKNRIASFYQRCPYTLCAHTELGLMRVWKPDTATYTLEPEWSLFINFED
ncbi:MAG: hypothetical protein RR297_10020 [Clostridia bacterium]